MEDNLLISWDVDEVFKSHYLDLLGMYEDQIADGSVTEEKVREEAYNDSDIVQLYWGETLNRITVVLEQYNPLGYWRVEGKNLGYRKINAVKYIKVDNGQQLIDEIFPKTDCTFKIYNDDPKLLIMNYHHDAPTGEQYHMVPCSEKDYLNNN